MSLLPGTKRPNSVKVLQTKAVYFIINKLHLIFSFLPPPTPPHPLPPSTYIFQPGVTFSRYYYEIIKKRKKNNAFSTSYNCNLKMFSLITKSPTPTVLYHGGNDVVSNARNLHRIFRGLPSESRIRKMQIDRLIPRHSQVSE